jgi:HlyD family secretion protein
MPNRLILVSASLSVLAVLTGCATRPVESKETPPTAPDARPATAGIGCLGRILPENGTFYVSPYTAGGRAPVLEDVRIKPGDNVVRGQVIAVMSSQPYLQVAVREAQARVNLARERLARVQAAPLPEEKAVVEAEIARLQVDRDAAEHEYQRNKPLYEKDFLAKAQLDALETRVRESDALIKQARERLSAIGKVHPEDAAIAEAEIRVANAELERTQQDVVSSVVRAPCKARVLRLIGHAGEQVGPQGIAEFAEVGKMAVFAEVYESDIARVRAGQKATITSELLPQPVSGVVSYIAPQIERQEPVSVEPGAPSDARIFRVRLTVQEADQNILADRINGQVKIVIEP